MRFNKALATPESGKRASWSVSRDRVVENDSRMKFHCEFGKIDWKFSKILFALFAKWTRRLQYGGEDVDRECARFHDWSNQTHQRAT